MAGFADLLIQGAQQSAQKEIDFVGGLQKGAQLAQQIEQTKIARQQIEDAKVTQQINKASKIMDAIEKGSQFKDKAAQNMFFKNYVPGMVKALKMEEFFNPDLMGYIQGSQEVRDKMAGLKLDIQDKISRGELRGAAIIDYAKSKLQPEELPLLDTDALLEQQKFATSEEGKTYRANIVQQGQRERQQTDIGATGQKAVAKRVADEFATYQAGGGKAGIESSIRNLKDAASTLETGKVKTGGVSTLIPGFKSDTVQSVINPQMSSLKVQARSALNNVLRATLGSAFTEAEGERVLSQIWDDKQPPAENARRIRNKLKELEQNVKEKEAEFKAQGFQVKSSATASDWKLKLKGKKDAIKALPPTEAQRVIKGLAEKLDVPIEDITKELGD